MSVFQSGYDRAVAVLSRPDITMMLVYAAGLGAGVVMQVGASGQPLLAIAAPVVAGVLIRLSKALTLADAFRLAAVHLVFAIGFGQPLSVFGVEILQNIASIGCAAFVFAELRARGFISSQLKVAVAVAVVAVAAAAVAAGVTAVAAPAPSIGSIAATWASVATGFALVLWVVLAHDRDDAPFPAEIGGVEDRSPSALEHVAAATLVGTLLIAAVWHGRPEAALAASTTLLWFALRLGLFPTSIAAFSFALALLGFAAEGRWPLFIGSGDALEVDLFRYIALALLAAPSILVAAAAHDQKRAKQAFAYRAMHDGLTELANRSRFIEALNVSTQAARSGRQRFALLLIDLDFFKSVNDTFGHARGDALLVEVSRRLRDSVRATDMTARIGGDEFAVLAPVRTVDDAQSLARRLVETVNQPFDLDGVSYAPSITIGGVLAPDSACEPARLMLLADEALYLAKAAGRNCWRFKVADAETERSPAWAMGEGAVRTETVFID